MHLELLAVSGDSDPLFFLVALVVVVVIVASFNKKKKLRPNECPRCHKDTLETRQRFWGGSYRRCKRWTCSYDERKIAAAHQRAAQEQAERQRFERERSERDNINYERERFARRKAESNDSWV